VTSRPEPNIPRGHALHLGSAHRREPPGDHRTISDFLAAEARDAEALYILGDLFESWVGDDAADPAQAAAIAGIKRSPGGVPCFVMHGNRDFLLAGQFCRMSGAALLPDPLIVTLYGEPVLVMHGDALCAPTIAAYQRLRATVRDPDWQRQFLALSVESRRALAGAARAGSQAHTAAMEYAITDVNAASVALALRGAGTTTLLHGHTHRPAIHALEVDGRACTRIVLGDWYHQGSVLRWDHGGPELVSAATLNLAGSRVTSAGRHPCRLEKV
jgi:UDP-2,3-diacylglucosamine hydrolase